MTGGRKVGVLGNGEGKGMAVVEGSGVEVTSDSVGEACGSVGVVRAAITGIVPVGLGVGWFWLLCLSQPLTAIAIRMMNSTPVLFIIQAKGAWILTTRAAAAQARCTGR